MIEVDLTGQDNNAFLATQQCGDMWTVWLRELTAAARENAPHHSPRERQGVGPQRKPRPARRQRLDAG
jgi:hypothetical protein